MPAWLNLSLPNSVALIQSALTPWIDQTVGTFPTPALEACVPFMNQIATFPLVSCQRRSPLPLALTSPVPTIDDAVATFPTPALEACAPFMNQIATLPLVSRQRMSLLPSPLKSPVPAIDQTVGTAPTAAACVTCAPFI